MNIDLERFISDEADDFYARLVDGSIEYDGRWMNGKEAIEAWVKNETAKFASALEGALELMLEEHEGEREERGARVFYVGQRVVIEEGEIEGTIDLDVGDGYYEVVSGEDLYLVTAAEIDPVEED